MFNISASYNGHTQIVKFLIKKNADVNHKNNNGDTSLIFGILFNLYLNNLN